MHELALERGITNFLTDYTTPLGLLALETLLDLRKDDDSFRVYGVRSLPFLRRRTYRLVQETPVEMAILAGRADYDYEVIPMEAGAGKAPNAVMIYTEAGIWVAEGSFPNLKIPH